MALDHFVSQVHLKNFYAAKLNLKKMYAIRKSDLKQFSCDARDVCRIEDGSTTQYLDEPRAIEEFVKPIERNYSLACKNVSANKIDHNTVFVIAGFAAFLDICSPTSLRI